MGSHDDITPAGGRIVGLEERPDGLYAIPELNDKGAQALQDGAYRYHSPEVIWEGAGFEDPNTGASIPGPLIVGDALLHMPHLGDAAALYQVEAMEVHMSETVTVPAGLWDKFVTYLDSRLNQPAPQVQEPVIPDEYKAAVTERDELKVRIADAEHAAARKARVEQFDAELKTTKADPTLADMLADLAPEQAEAIMRQLKALSEQVKEPEITGEVGTEGTATDGDPKAQFNAIVLDIATKQNLLYNAAFEVGKVQHNDLFRQAFVK